MHTASQIGREFFERYERSRSTIDASRIDERYPDAFMFAGPPAPASPKSRRSWPVCQRGSVLHDTWPQVDQAGDAERDGAGRALHAGAGDVFVAVREVVVARNRRGLLCGFCLG